MWQVLVNRDCGSLEASMDFDKLVGASSLCQWRAKCPFCQTQGK